jgi:hypothetical protein
MPRVLSRLAPVCLLLATVALLAVPAAAQNHAAGTLTVVRRRAVRLRRHL